MRQLHILLHSFGEISALVVEGEEEAFGDAVGVVVRENAKIGVDLRRVGGGKHGRKFAQHTVQRMARYVAAVGSEVCAKKLNAGVRVGD